MSDPCVSGDSTTLLLKIARLSFQKGDCLAARDYALTAKEQSLASGLLPEKNWIEAQKVLLAARIELREAEPLLALKIELEEFLLNCEDRTAPYVYFLLARWEAYYSRYLQARVYIEQGIADSLEFGDMEALAYNLFGLARIEVAVGNDEKALQEVEKVETILTSQPRDDIEIALHLIKIQIYKKKNNFPQALEFAWRAYEFAKQTGYHFYVPIILVEVAILLYEQKSLDEARIYLTLAEKGTSEKDQPLLFSFIQGQKKVMGLESNEPSYDLVVDEASKVIRERHKGVIDFKNQHTLLEMALLFLKHPHSTYTKEQLFEQIWKQAYDPAIHDNLIYVTVKRLRSLIEPDVNNPKYILRNRSGYYFNNSHSLFIQTETNNL